MTWYDVESLPLAYMSYLGVLAHYLGTNHRTMVLVWNILAWLAHIGETLYANSLCSDLKLSSTSTTRWLAQTFLLGYPSLRLLIKYAKQSQ